MLKPLQFTFHPQAAHRFETRENAPDPSLITPQQWQHLVSLQTRYQLKKYFHYLKVTQDKNQLFADKKAVKQALAVERKREAIERKKNCEHIYYGLGGSALLPRITEKTIMKWYSKR